ncbi:unnamed protein product [Prorocentrum cordatum]|uniref:AAA+ ATPase domain-containing protein n=1 Tax=Prorocentrum cordatum TaxID=2364126 RepID=A0ABN9RMR8_9DINO|nr:unnamed protein product [Polarella glacialis]
MALCAHDVNLGMPEDALTPVRKRRRLCRIDSGEKENRPALANAPATSRVEAEQPPRRAPPGRQQPPQASPKAFPKEYPLIARERECAQLDAFIDRCLAGGPSNGGCLYVSGGPGTGKTCSARAAAAARQSRSPETQIIEVNCMNLQQRTTAGLFRHLEEAAGVRRHTRSGTAAEAAAALGQLGSKVVVIVDEVDQLVGTTARLRAAGLRSLGSLASLPLLPGAPALALVTIANAVGLFSQDAELARLCEPLLFKPYEAGQLRSIAQSRLAEVLPLAHGAPAAGSAASAHPLAGALGVGSLAMEVKLRQVAKNSGDCRQVMHVCESAVLEQQAAREEAAAASEGGEACSSAAGKLTAIRGSGPAPTKRDPLASVEFLPLEQQVLLLALTGAKSEAVRVAEVCQRYKALSQRLHQPLDLAKEEVREALLALEQQGLLSLRAPRRGGGGRGGGGGGGRAAPARAPAQGDWVAELAVVQAVVRERIFQANSTLERCMQQ